MVAAGLTLFSGFGLGTILLPAFAVFFPVEVAVGATAVVHLANNLFKLALIGRWAAWGVVLRFGVPAVIAAFGGAALLAWASGLAPIATYELFGGVHEISPVKLVVGALVGVFALLELSDRLERAEVPVKLLPVGGALSGFFGGLSGHQGALRSAFLVRAGLEKQAFVGTSAVCSAMVDVVRLVVYVAGAMIASEGMGLEGLRPGLVAAACGAAFVGTFVGSRLVEKVTMRAIRVIVAVMLTAASALMIAGVI
jgi:uncharacterized membrane protein YfcA